MTAIFRGRRYRVISQTETTVCLELVAASGTGIDVPKEDPDLLLHPTADDLHVSEAFERGEIEAFEYADGRTYPPGREIPQRRRRVAQGGSAARVH